MKDWTGRFDDPSYLSPFAEEMNAGYLRFNHIDDGTMWDMLKPGNSGVGVHVGHLFSPDCCCGYYNTASDVAAYKDQFNPWLYPSLVNWHSVMTPAKQPHSDYIRNFAVDYPVVAITHVRSSINEFRWALNNLNYEGDTCRLSYEPNEDNITMGDVPILGVVPIWAVMPLYNEDRIRSVSNSIHRLNLETNLEMLSECWCTLEGIPCDEDCEREQDYSKECTCQVQEKIGVEIENLYNDPVVVEDYMDETTKQIWKYSVGRFYDGWQVLSETSHLGEQWAFYWQRAQSPFSALPGQNFRDLLELTSSTNSVTQQAS